MGLPEAQFWDMTKAEIERYLEGAVWRLRIQAQFDYVLSNTIGLSMARMMDKNVKFPSVEEVYPTLFIEPETEEKRIAEEERRMTDSANNFLAFARQHNARMNKGVETINDD